MLEEKSVKNWLKRKVKFTQALLVAFLITGGVGYAVDNVPGKGAGVAIGTGSEAPKAENVAVGKNATVSYSNGDSKATGDIVVGNDANINNYASQGGSIAIGKNAKIENMTGRQESIFGFGQTEYKNGNFWGTLKIPVLPEKVIGSVAIGDNTFVRTGGTMIGSHNYRGKLGDIEVDTSNTRKQGLNVYATTIGANSFSSGAFATTTGAFSIISSDYDGGGYSSSATKNIGASIYGSLNSIESSTSNSSYSGIANSIVGVANRTNNANGSLIFGAGNEITNSIKTITKPSNSEKASVKEFSDELRKVVRSSNSGGSTMAFGGGNKADWTQLTSMIGVNNIITGDKDNVAKYNMISGYKNTITKSSENIVSGTNYSVSGEGKNILMGFNKEENKVEKKNVVALGNDIKVNTDNSVYLGSGSTDAETKATKGMEEYSKATINGKEKNFAGGTPAGIVSVGSTGKERRIQNVAAGLISKDSTDAVNGSQLYAVAEELQNKVDAPITADKITEKGSIADSTDIKVTGTGTDRLVGTGNISFTIKDNAVTKKKLSTEVQNTLDRVGKGKIEEGDNNTVTGDTVYKYKVENDKKLNGKVEKDEFHNYQNTTNDRMNKMESETRHVGALSASLAALHPMQYDPLQKSQVMAGVGTYRDKQAIAVGVAHYFNENLMMTAGVSLGEDTRTKSMANLGLTWKIGSDDDRKDLPERYKEGPIGSIYMMQTEMEQVMNENKDLKKLTQTQQQEIEMMKQQIQMLMEKVK
ncbi:YadA-like family protein [Fusobacterium gonidiaformans]|uniref:YadA-like family protein n=1 Tax=Fusobacterium gonidiaformans TaxID=849 RepID=UPI000673D0A8|nr:YadA-like family protein [Fusobacterium gonidiaformans]AVQ17594.1 S-layer protein [Fusobacterium gonidiaformans ATCC 25563]EFS27892.2 hypothetical protein FGAG_00213 [Fusobacterium gonidiaformans ATCC 25563]